MSAKVKLRLILLALALLASAGTMIWFAGAGLSRIVEMEEGLRIAEYVDEEVVLLQAELRALEHFADAEKWRDFLARSRQLEAWMGRQERELITARERALLERIEAEYASFLKSARRLAEGVRQGEFADHERLQESAIGLREQLGDIRRLGVRSYLADSHSYLALAQRTIVILLLVLVGVAAWLALAVYRGMIAPLRTQLVETNAALERSERLASLGVLAAGVAHEIRNPLTAINARLYTHRKAFATGSDEAEAVEFVREEIERLERIVRAFLEFARPPEPEKTLVPPAALLREVMELLEPGLREARIDLVVAEADEQPVPMDPRLIKQVLVNFVRNSAESIPGQGRITLRARRDRRKLHGQRRDVVILEVQDDGKGVPEKARDRLFDPFFTTKPSGTGLGLAIAARIVEKHGGALEYQSRVNRGSTFRIVLPIDQTP